MAVTAGIVLAGGASRRMGSDKTQLVLDGRTLMERSVDAIRPYCAEQAGGAGVFVVLGEAARAVPQGAHELHDSVQDQGPLRGLATGLAEAALRGAERAVVLSADLPLITSSVVGELLQAFAANQADASPVEAILAADQTSTGQPRTHPLIGVYSTALAEPASAALERGERAMMAFLNTRAARAAHAIRTLQVKDPLALSNVNTPQEWADIRRLRSDP